MKHILLLTVLLSWAFTSFAQHLRPPAGVSLVTTPRGVGYTPKPDKSAEWIKHVVVIPKDRTYFSMQIKEYKQGAYVSERMDDDWIFRYVQLDEGEKLLFELVPDVSASSKLSLFVYTPGSLWIKTRYATEGHLLKYVRYEARDEADAEGILPLLLVYEDSATGEVEKEIAKHTVDGRLPATYVPNSPLVKKLPHCMVVYCHLKDQ